MRSTIRRTITSLVLVIAMVVGMTASLGGTAKAGIVWKVIFNLNGGTVSPTNTKKTVEVKVEYGGVTQAKSGYYYPGKSIIGWAETSSGPIKYLPNANIYPEKNMTLYAIWGNPGCQLTMVRSTTGSKVITNFPAGTKIQYEQLCTLGSPAGYHPEFYTNSSLKTKISFPYTIRVTTVFYYKPIANKCKVRFHYDGKTVEGYRYTDCYLTGPRIKHTDEVLIGWSESPDGSSGIYRDDHICCFTKDNSVMDLYPIYLTKKEEDKNYQLLMNKADLEKIVRGLTNRINVSYQRYTECKNATEMLNMITTVGNDGVAILGAILSIPFSVAGCVITCSGILAHTYITSGDTRLTTTDYAAETKALSAVKRDLNGIKNTLDINSEELLITVTASYLDNQNYYWDYKFYKQK